MNPTDAKLIHLSDGRAKEIRFTLRTFKTLKSKFKMSFLNGEGWQNIDEDMLPEVLYESLVDKSDITLDELYDLVTIDTVPAIMEAVALAIGGNKQKDEVETSEKKV